MNEPQNLHEGEEAEAATDLHAVIEEYEARPDECTVSPGDVPSERETTTWISAKGKSFVSVTDWQ